MKLLKRKLGINLAPAGAVNVRSLNYASSPLLAAKTPSWRSKFLVALVGLSFCGLLGRAVYVQIIDSAFFLRQGEARYARTLALPASRGRILDRNGLIMAASVPSPSIWVSPKDLDTDVAKRKELARLLGLTPKEFALRLEDNPNFVWLRRQVDNPVAKDVMALKMLGVGQLSEYKRKYPEGEAAAHLVGYTSVDDAANGGIEKAFQRDLMGQAGTRRVIKDRMGRVVEDIGDRISAVDGQEVTLSIDSKAQFFAYQRIRDAVAEHKAKAGSVVVLDVQTGEVLALANFPSFSPSNRENLTGEQARNRALTDTFEPGSTIKPFIAALAMETGRVTPNTVIQTAPGRMVIGGSTISDAHPHGALTVAQIVQKSSNVGTVKLAMQMQPREMHELFTQLGFGQKPQINFPGAVSGRLRPFKTWRPIEQATMSYGYGLSASLFQIARAYSVVAHDGELLPSSLVKVDAAPAGMRVMSVKTAQAVREMLNMVTLEGGTATKAQAMGYSVGGKTGTAYKQEGKGYNEKKYRAWFVGIAPIRNPRIVVAVMVDEPSAGKYYGGDVAAPVFSEVVQQTLRTLGVQPDLDVRQQIVMQKLPAEVESF